MVEIALANAEKLSATNKASKFKGRDEGGNGLAKDEVVGNRGPFAIY